jgi:hypothetical protein
MLEVVQYEQCALAPQHRGQPLVHRNGVVLAEAECARDGRADEIRVTQRGEVDEHGAVREVGRHLCRHFQREPRLAHPAGAGEGE